MDAHPNQRQLAAPWYISEVLYLPEHPGLHQPDRSS